MPEMKTFEANGEIYDIVDTQARNHMTNTENPHGVTARQTGGLPLTGGTMTGPINMNSQRITNVPEPTDDSDPVVKSYLTKKAFSHMSSSFEEAGWYRVAEYSGVNENDWKGVHANMVDLIIKRPYYYDDNEYHVLRIRAVHDNVDIISLDSKSNSRIFTKVRVVRTSDSEYIELYYSVNTRNECYITLDKVTDNSYYWHTITAEKTEENIDGVTIMATYDIPANAEPVNSLTAAPAGYGLGTEATQIVTSVEALDNLKAGGWYHLNKVGTVIANIWFTHASISVYPYALGNCTQELRPLNTNVVLTRHSYNDAWSEWEVENPPMELGVEYRTTERWNGKPVYIKTLNVGSFPATANTLVSVDSSMFGAGITGIVDYGGEAYTSSRSNVLSLPYHSTSAHLYMFANMTGLAVWSTTAGYSAYSVTAWVKYTKN